MCCRYHRGDNNGEKRIVAIAMTRGKSLSYYSRNEWRSVDICSLNTDATRKQNFALVILLNFNTGRFHFMNATQASTSFSDSSVNGIPAGTTGPAFISYKTFSNRSSKEWKPITDKRPAGAKIDTAPFNAFSTSSNFHY